MKARLVIYVVLMNQCWNKCKPIGNWTEDMTSMGSTKPSPTVHTNVPDTTSQTQSKPRSPDPSNQIPGWAIAAIVAILLMAVIVSVLVFCSTDDEGHIHWPPHCCRKRKGYYDKDNPSLTHGYSFPFGHVAMGEVRRGRLYKRDSERSLTENSNHHSISVRKERDVAIIDTGKSIGTPTDRPIEFASNYEIHEITARDPNRCPTHYEEAKNDLHTLEERSRSRRYELLSM